MRLLSICFVASTTIALAACGDDGTSIDAATIDARAIDATVDAPVVAQTCANYCTTIQANCLDAASNRQYIDSASCTASCGYMPVGAATDTQGDTLGCRIYHAGAAAGNATLHCPHAGPGGDGACGTNCAGFCQIVMGACTGANVAYPSAAACMTACAAFPTATRYNTKEMTGNSFACKLYHATVATTAPATHCAHVKATGGPCTAPAAF